jgi:RNA polymerase sigma-70 factor, ECF subfamily
MSSPDEFQAPPALSALHAGEPRAWQQAFGMLWGTVLRVTRRQLPDAGEAEEVAAQALQETRLAARATQSWEEIMALAIVIARRRAISRVRSLAAIKRQPGSTVSLDGEVQAEVGEAPQYAALRALDVQAILAPLPPSQRELLQDYFLEGMTSEEVAHKRGVPATTVRSQIMRLLAQLRDRQRDRSNSQDRESDSHLGASS